MPILNKPQIKKLLSDNKLIRNSARDENGEFTIEAASYDLRVGTLLWQDATTKNVRLIEYDDKKPSPEPFTVQPGQMVFVITHEELWLPPEICGTVYSRNKLQKQNILALNAGHVDPGYEGPIIIRLINLGLHSWPIRVGDAVFTVVFHTVDIDPEFRPKDRRTKEQMVAVAMETALQAFSNPFHDLYKRQIQEQLDEHYLKFETSLHKKLSKEFFTRDDLKGFLFFAGAIIVGALFILTRMPWSTLWIWFKCLLHMP
jgi:deoxycytidine triphosphate deaminase